jgi:ZIP family zinc transporter
VSPTILILGTIAGLTIFLGLPVGRLRHPQPRLKTFLNATATGVLLFLLWDVITKGIAPVTAALTSAANGKGPWLNFVGLGATFATCFVVGLMSLVYYDIWMGRRALRLRPSGPGAMASKELAPPKASVLSTPAHRLAFMIAIGIGMHNFSEGLAIGQSAAAGAIGLALVLVIGFGLHNATEGFGIVAPMAGQGERPTWGYLALLGLIGGAPTAIGTFVGQAFVNDTLFLGFLALAAGSILYVIIQMLGVGARLGHKQMMMWGLLLGLFAGFGTDFILTAAGA